MKASILILYFFFILSSAASAQVNTEKMRVDKDLAGFSGRISMSISLQTGNVEVLDTGCGLRLQYDADRHRTFLVGDMKFARNRSEEFKNRGFAHLRYNYMFRKSIRGEFFTQYEYNEFIRLFNRRLFGTGVRINLHQSDNKGVYYGSSFMYEFEQIDIKKDSGDDPEYSLLRWSNYLVFKWEPGERSALVNSLYIQPALEDFEDTRILDEFDLQTGITDKLVMILGIRFRYDSLPPTGVKKADMEIMNSISYTF
ncbi:MAG: DUF481 domain-containing protein [bacterium]|nr:DUF481 domain-containing protein [bacterium]